jgi:hypothetical protein
MDVSIKARRMVALVVIGVLGVVASGCGDDGGSSANGQPAQKGDAKRVLDPSRFTAKVDHPLMPLSSVPYTLFKGHEGSGAERITIRVEHRVLDETYRIAGVEATVVKVREYENGELVEATRDYFAQRKDGSVFYLGEHVDDYKDGKIVGHGGEWIAGKGNAKPGLFMPGTPKVGQKFEQERAPGVAEDRSTVVAVGLAVKVSAGAFSNCIKTRDFAPLDKVTEFKFYCSGVGLVREKPKAGRLDLVRYR